MSRKQQFQHAEAYCLMKYVSEADGRVEWIWNSRDGVTPFMVIDNIGCTKGLSGRSPTGQPLMQHDDWHEDIFCPNFVPFVGMRIFVDGEKDERGNVSPHVRLVTREIAAEFERLAHNQPMRFVDDKFARVPTLQNN